MICSALALTFAAVGQAVTVPSSLSSRVDHGISALRITLPVAEEVQTEGSSVLHWSEVPEAFPVRYRGWSVVGYNGAAAESPIIEGNLKLSRDKSDYTRSAVLQVYPAFGDARENRWQSEDPQWGASSWGVTASRKGGADYIDFPKPSDYAALAEMTVRGPRMSLAPSIAWSGGYYFSYNQQRSDPTASLSDLVDLNGDRFPEVMGEKSALFTLMDGALEAKARGLDGRGIRKSEEESQGVTLGPVPLMPGADEGGRQGTATTNQPAPRFVPPAISIGFGSGNGDGRYDLIDVNGDGLPDRVYQSDNGLEVALNLGYRFEDAELWAVANKSDKAKISATSSRTESFSFDIGSLVLGWGTFDMSFSGGKSLTTTKNRTTSALQDMNGDGWADALYTRAEEESDPESGSVTTVKRLYVALNTGGGFAAPTAWKGALTGDLSKSASVSESVNYSATVSIPLPPFGVPFLVITRGKTEGDSVSNTEARLLDINGDGYTDSVKSTSGESLTVALSQAKRTNLLHTVKRPLGAEITLDYTPVGNTHELPQSRWVLSKVTVFDGAKDIPARDKALSSDYQITAFGYEKGYYHRFEREFLGFARVVESQLDTAGLDGDKLSDATPYREVVRKYRNKTVYERGLLREEKSFDARPGKGRSLKLATLNSYGFRKVVKKAAAEDAATGDTAASDATTASDTPENDTAAGDTAEADAAEADTGDTAESDATVTETTTTDTDANLKRATTRGLTIFPYLKKSERRFHEGSGYRATTSEYEYDAYGNVNVFHDGGDSDVEDDDVWARITYTGVGDETRHADCVTAYIVGQPERIEVRESRDASSWLRKREADFNCTTGATKVIRSYLDDTKYADTKLFYNNYGNLTDIEGPENLHAGERLTLQFLYDETATNSYVTEVKNLSYQYASTAGYDPKWGKPTFTKDINGETITYAYDDFGRLKSVHAPKEADKATLTFDYHPYTDFTKTPFVSWAKTEHFDADTGTTGTIDTLLFTDGLKRVVQTKKDATVNESEVMIVSGRATLDAFGRTVRQYYPTTETKGAGNTDFTKRPNTDTPPTKTRYDVLDRVRKTVAPDGTETTMNYALGQDAFGRERFKSTVKDAEGKEKTSYRDTRELITTVTETLGTETLTTRYGYDRLKQITQVVDTKENVTTAAYDKLGRRTGIKNPDTGRVSYGYDLAGNLTEKVTPNLKAQGEDVGIHYDYFHSRLVSITYPNTKANNVYYVYGEAADSALNQVGRIKKIQHGGGVEAREYGLLGEITKETKTLTQGPSFRVFVTQYDYDSFGRLLTLTLPDSETLSHHYDAGGNLEQIVGTKGGSSTTYLQSLTYDAFEQRKTMKLGNGIETRYSYDPTSRRLCRLQSGLTVEQSDTCASVADARGETLKSTLSSLTAASPGQFQNLHYAYDKVGNILGLGNAVPIPAQNALGGPVVQVFGYDDLYRLTSASGVYHESDRLRHEYTLGLEYDSLHNITQKTQRALQYNGDKAREEVAITYDWAYAYNPSGETALRPHAPNHIGDRSFHHDANGNQTGWENDSNGTRRTIVWDEENRISEIRDPGNTLRFLYDDQGMRTLKKGEHGETVYVNQYYTLKNGAITSKHVFAGTSRIASRVITAEQAPRTQSPGYVEEPGVNETPTIDSTATLQTSEATFFSDTSLFTRGKSGKSGKEESSLNPGQAKKAAREEGADVASNTATGEATTADTTANSHPGQGIAHRSDRANEVAQNTLKNPNITGIFPGQGLLNRSENANEHASNTEKNPNLNGSGDVGGGTIGDGDTGGNDGGSTGGGNSGSNSGNNGNGGGPSSGGDNTGNLQGADFLYYYHPDHLGSTGYVTDDKGRLYEHIQYLPFGETWAEQSSNIWRTPYQYTGKELDPETGLYYYGARYYDPRTSVWVSADPILGDYLNGQRSFGGVFNPVNLSLYSYAGLNPIILLDPNGNEQAGFWTSTGQRFSNLTVYGRFNTNEQDAQYRAALAQAYREGGTNGLAEHVRHHPMAGGTKAVAEIVAGGGIVSLARKDPVTLDIFSGSASQTSGAIAVDIVTEQGVKASAKALPFASGSVDEIIASNPYIKNGAGIMDYLPEAARALKAGGQLLINATKGNKFGKLPDAATLKGLGLKVAQEAGPLAERFKNQVFRTTEGRVIPNESVRTTILQKVE